MRIFLCLILTTILTTPALAELPVVVTQIDGSQLAGDLEEWNTDSVSLRTNDDTVSVAASQLLRLGWPLSEAKTGGETNFLQLVDGTRVPYETFVVEDRQAIVSSSLANEPFAVPTALISYVQFRPDAPDLASNELEGDTIVIYKKKSGSFDRLSGVLGDVTTEQVRFSWEGDTIPVKRTKVAALAYFHAKVPKAEKAVCWLRVHGGGQLPVASLSIESDSLAVRTTGDLAFSIPITAVVAADYSEGKLTYLSDLTPRSQTWHPRIDLPKTAEMIQSYGLPRRDQSFSGSAITLVWPDKKTGILGGQHRTFEKGLALRSRTTLRYRLPAGMTRFLTTAGIDPETAAEGHVTLEIFADKRSVWQGEISGGDEPTKINAEFGQARELRIVVGYGENLDFGDRLHLAEACVSR